MSYAKLFLVPALVGIFALSGRMPSGNTFRTSTIGAKAYAISSSGTVLDSSDIDASGNYQFVHLTAGTYNIRICRPGAKDVVIQDVEHSGSSLSYHFYDQNYTHGIRGADDYRSSSDAVTLDAAMPHVAVRGSRVGGVVESVSPGSVAISSDADRASDFRPARKSISRGAGAGDIPTSTISAGQMTAGVWRDLDNWDEWQKTNSKSEIEAYQREWGFYTQNRYSVQFLDNNGDPVIGYPVVMKDKYGVVLWKAVTNNLGKVECFEKLFENTNYRGLNARNFAIAVGERSFDFDVMPYLGSTEIIRLPVKAETAAVADVAFVVDATGSMGDEISYLQSELLDVVTRVKKNNTCLDLRMGSVFYRDHSDEYVTRKTDFSSNIATVANFIYDQSAGGGGDFPEAVDMAMETAVGDLKWSEKAIARIMFLILDAPPHGDSAVTAKMRKYTALAAEKGITIIPIVASGINQSTEFLMKYLAIATNGSYVYITDHSGIGDTHEKPTGVKENVQLLNDLMVEIITNATKWNGCDSQTKPNNNQTPGTVEIISNGQWQVQVYPNPAVDHIMIKSNETPDEISIWDTRGNLVKKVDQIAAEKNEIDLSNVSTGIYFVKLRKGESSVSCRILVMK